jgi:hypothetical protein
MPGRARWYERASRRCSATRESRDIVTQSGDAIVRALAAIRISIETNEIVDTTTLGSASAPLVGVDADNGSVWALLDFELTPGPTGSLASTSTATSVRLSRCPASHGCVRLTNGATDWFWASGDLALGTAVWVY